MQALRGREMPANASWNLSVFTWAIFCWACTLIYPDDNNLSDLGCRIGAASQAIFRGCYLESRYQPAVSGVDQPMNDREHQIEVDGVWKVFGSRPERALQEEYLSKSNAGH